MDACITKVNETHMCVLRKTENNKKLKVDFVELKYVHQVLLKAFTLSASKEALKQLKVYMESTIGKEVKL